MHETERAKRELAWSVAAWVVAGMVLFLLERQIWNAFGFVAMMIVPGYALLGLVLLGVILWHLRRRETRRFAALAAAAILAAGAGFRFGGPTLMGAGDAFFFQARFARMRPRYEAIAERAARSSTTERLRGGREGGIHYTVDAGPPVRVAFLQPGGIVDNWEGVVHDPTGAVAAARGWKHTGEAQDFTAPAGGGGAVRRQAGEVRARGRPVLPLLVHLRRRGGATEFRPSFVRVRRSRAFFFASMLVARDPGAPAPRA